MDSRCPTWSIRISIPASQPGLEIVHGLRIARLSHRIQEPRISLRVTDMSLELIHLPALLIPRPWLLQTEIPRVDRRHCR